MKNATVIRVGIDEGDIRGSDHRAIQGAVEYLAMIGGGVVEIGPGEYALSDSIHLRSGVHLRGAGEATILRMSPAHVSELYSDAGCGETVFTPKDPSGFEIGQGVTLSSRRTGGYHSIVATIVGRANDTFAINKECVSDYTVQQGGYAATVFPMISGIRVSDVTLSDLTLDGNRTHTAFLNGCRGAGIYFYGSSKVTIRDCVVHHYNGDGISYQKSDDVILERCECRHNAGSGVHPGTGSPRTVLRNCKFLQNDGSGLFVCWRVKHGIFDSCEMRGNHQSGISIGHQDTDNVFRRNVIEENVSAGIFFRQELEPMGAHRNRFEHNRILNNGKPDDAYGVLISGETHDLTFVGNTIGDTRSEGAPAQVRGVYMRPGVERVSVEDTEWVNLPPEVRVVVGD